MKYTLLISVIAMAIIILYHSLIYLTGIFGAGTMYILMRGHLRYLTNIKKFKKPLAASIILLETILIWLIPSALVVWVIASRVDSINFNISSIITNFNHFIDAFRDKTHIDILSPDMISKLGVYMAEAVQIIFDQVGSFIISSVVLLFVLYFMLVASEPMERYIIALLPFTPINKVKVLKELEKLVKSNAISIPVLAVVQGFFATLGYFLFKTPSPLLFGFLTSFATIIPVVGTMIVWLPLAIYMMTLGKIGIGFGLIFYGFLVIASSDNITRFVLQKKLVKTNPLITVFGVLVGITIFGFWGVIIGPVFFSIFFLCFDIYCEQYIKGDTKLVQAVEDEELHV